MGLRGGFIAHPYAGFRRSGHIGEAQCLAQMRGKICRFGSLEINVPRRIIAERTKDSIDKHVEGHFIAFEIDVDQIVVIEKGRVIRILAGQYLHILVANAFLEPSTQRLGGFKPGSHRLPIASDTAHDDRLRLEIDVPLKLLDAWSVDFRDRFEIVQHRQSLGHRAKKKSEPLLWGRSSL